MTLIALGVKGPSSHEYTAETYLKGHLEHMQLYLSDSWIHPYPRIENVLNARAVVDIYVEVIFGLRVHVFGNFTECHKHKNDSRYFAVRGIYIPCTQMEYLEKPVVDNYKNDLLFA